MLQLCKGVREDFEFYYNLKSEPSTVHWEGYSKKPDKQGLKQYFYSLVDNQLNKQIYFIKDTGREGPYGYIQLTFVTEAVLEIGYAVCERFRGNGYGQYAVGAIKKEGACLGKTLTGYVADNNIASRKCFEKNGFRKKADNYKVCYFPFFGKDIKLYQYVLERF